VTKEQERARARRRQQKLDAREAEQARQAARNRQVAIVVVAVLAVVGLFVFLSSQLADDSGDPAAQPSASAPASASATGSGRCAPAPATPKSVTPVDKPAPSTAAGKTFEAVVTTNCGDITLELDGEKAPQTVASFAALAKAGYWADSPCHRLTTQGIFVLQCGDPLGGAGPGPGYTFGLENTPKDGSYPKGTLAMARTSDPNSNSGQFFIVYDDTQLPTEGGGYSIFGTVTAGMDIVEEIAAAGVDGGAGDGAPATPISILKVAVTEKKA
jgi:peptidyl-prolyl cis-trans isomerase B (cyclophilin B)